MASHEYRWEKGSKIHDAVIVGGGISGMTCAFELLSASPDLNVLVLEAKERLGGRTFTTPLKTAAGTDLFDLGGQWVSSLQTHVLDLLLELGLDTYPQFVTGTKFMQLGDNSIRQYEGEIPTFSMLALIDWQWFVFKLNRLSKQIDVDNPFSHPRALELDSMTAETYVNNSVYTKEVKDAIDIAVRTTFGCESSSLSMLYMLFYAQSAGGLMNLCAVEGGAQEFRVKGGTQQISEKIAEQIGLENVRLSTPVKAIYRYFDSQEGYLATLLTESNEMIHARYVIMAIPLHLAAEIKFEPPLPNERTILMTSMPMGNMGKFVVTYSKAFWRDKGFSGEIVSSGGPKIVEGCDTGPVGVVYDCTTYQGSPALVGFFVGKQGVQWSNKPYEMRKLAVLKALCAFLGEEALDPIEYAEKLWVEEPYSGGCPVNFAAPGVMQLMANNHLRSPIDRIYWAGTETATAWCGYMNGAVQSGRRAAKEVLHSLRPMGSSRGASSNGTNKTDLKTGCNCKSHQLYIVAVAVLAILAFFYMIQMVE